MRPAIGRRQQEDPMLPLTGRNVVVIGGSRGVGRRVVEAAIRNDARVLAVARQEGPLRQLANEVPGTEILSLDATDDGAPGKVFDTLRPDILVVGAGAFPPAAPLHKQTWLEFRVNWETDVTACLAPCTKPRTRCKKPICAPGVASRPSKEGRFAPGCIIPTALIIDSRPRSGGD